MEKATVSKATLGRLPYYLEYLKTISAEGREYISATRIAADLSLGDVQVRKDLNAISGLGRPKIGYNIGSLTESIEDALGCNNLTNAVIVGAGRLGQAILDYEGFEDYGVRIMAAFDICTKTPNGKKPILPMDKLSDYCKENNIKIGIITVSSSAAQSVCDTLTSLGIRAIWNFSPVRLTTPANTVIKQENLALSLAHINKTI